MTWLEILNLVLLLAGLFFFVAGTLGLLRFPDAASRLHALTKADNAGLGLVALAAALHWASAEIALKIGLIWFFALFAAGTTAQLMIRLTRDAVQDRRNGDKT